MGRMGHAHASPVMDATTIKKVVTARFKLAATYGIDDKN